MSKQTAILEDIQDNDLGITWTYGTVTTAAWPCPHWRRFGGAYPDGRVGLQESASKVRWVKCASYRKAVRKLRQWCNGYNV